MDMFFYYFKLKITKSNAKFSDFMPGQDKSRMRHIYAEAGLLSSTSTRIFEHFYSLKYDNFT